MHRFLLFIGLATAAVAQVNPSASNLITITSGGGQTTQTQFAFAQPVTVQLTDGFGHPLAGATVTFTLPARGIGLPSATFPGLTITATATTNSMGYAASPRMTADMYAGNFQVTAVAGIASVRSTLGIAPPPSLIPVVTPDYLLFTMVLGDKAPPSQTLSVAGMGNLPPTSDSPWLKFIQRDQQFTDVSVDPTGLAAGLYEGRVTFNNVTFVRCFLRIRALPLMNSTLPSITFRYQQYANVLPLQQNFWVGSSVRNYQVAISTVYTNPTTGNWLGVASRVGVVLPAKLTAVADPRGMAPGTYLANISIQGEAGSKAFLIPVTLIVSPYNPPTRLPEINSVANAASLLDGAVTDGELVKVAGANLACDGKLSVTVDGDAAQVVSATDSEIGVVLPDSLMGKTRVPVQLTCGDATSNVFSVPVQDAVPALFTTAAPQAMAFNADSSANGDASPAARGDVVTLYGTGFGALDLPGADGTVGFMAPVSVNIGGTAAELVSAARATDMPGVVRIRVRVPAGIDAGRTEIEVQAGVVSASASIVVN